MTRISESEVLHYALVGFEKQRQEIDRRIAELRRQLNGAAGLRKRKERQLSPEGRAAIVAALKKRWANVRRMKRAKR